jgi:hypothetical protein
MHIITQKPRPLNPLRFWRAAAVMMVSVIMLLAPHRAEAKDRSFISGSMLYQYCNSSYDVDYGYCAGFVGAVAEIMHDQTVADYQACGFKTVRAQQLIDIFKNFAAQNKIMFNQDAKIMVAASIARAFPCQDQ